MERVLLAIVNWINIIQEIVEGSKQKKNSARFKRGNYNKIFFI